MSFKRPGGIPGKKKRLNVEWKPLLRFVFVPSKGFLFSLPISWSNKSSSCSLQMLPLLISLWWGHLNYRNHVDNHGVNNEINSFFVLPFLVPVEKGGTALSVFAVTSAQQFAVSCLMRNQLLGSSGL